MPTTSQFQPVLSFDQVAAIASGQTTSAEIDLAGCTLVGLRVPAAFTGTSVTFTSAEASGGTFQAVYRDGANVSLAVAASKQLSFDPSLFAGVRFLKVVSSAAEAADRSVTLVTRPV